MKKWVIVWINGLPRHWGEFVGFLDSKGFTLRDYSQGPSAPAVAIPTGIGSGVYHLAYAEKKELDLTLELLGLPPLPKAEEKIPKVEEKFVFRPIVAITGHRPDKLGGYKIPNPIYDKVVFGLAAALEHYKPSQVITGMSLGTDQWAAELCLNSGIPFVAAIPFENQDSKWPPHARSKYQWLLSHAAAKYIVTPGGYEAWKMQKRNEWMVNQCHGVIAVYNGTPGGTANCLGYAVQVGKPIYYVQLDPAGMLIGELPATPVAAPQAEPVQVGQETKRVIDL